MSTNNLKNQNNLTIHLDDSKHCYGCIIYKEKKYKVFFSHPTFMLQDETISWESKGVLSFLAFTDYKKVHVEARIIEELINNFYLVEV